MYCWVGEDQGFEDFVLFCYGNVIWFIINVYYCKDLKLLKEIDYMLEMGMFMDRVYSIIVKKKEEIVS